MCTHTCTGTHITHKHAIMHACTKHACVNKQKCTKQADMHQTCRHAPNMQACTIHADMHQTCRHAPNMHAYTKHEYMHLKYSQAGLGFLPSSRICWRVLLSLLKKSFRLQWWQLLVDPLLTKLTFLLTMLIVR